jgi:hypothetical protein
MMKDDPLALVERFEFERSDLLAGQGAWSIPRSHPIYLVYVHTNVDYMAPSMAPAAIIEGCLRAGIHSGI